MFEVRDLRFEFQGSSLPGAQVLGPRTLGGCRKAPSLFQTVPRGPNKDWGKLPSRAKDLVKKPCRAQGSHRMLRVWGRGWAVESGLHCQDVKPTGRDKAAFGKLQLLHHLVLEVKPKTLSCVECQLQILELMKFEAPPRHRLPTYPLSIPLSAPSSTCCKRTPHLSRI